ncbi:MAG: hypothetical protein ACLQU3_24385 [Limisphaerales bacterium]
MLAIFILATFSVLAEPPQPHINYIFPAGGQRGTTIQATVSGADLQNAGLVRILGGGATGSVVKVENPATVRVSIALAADAAPGERDLRLVTPGGASNRLRFLVGCLPELNEVEPNSEITQAQRLASLPVLINGQILPSDRDFYRFAVKAGQTIVCAAEARKIIPFIADAVPGWFDARLILYDGQGKELAYSDDYRFSPDPVLLFNVPADGEYVLEIRDVVSRGRADFIYRLSLGAFPHVTHLFPLGGQRGTNAHVELHGVNLPATALDFNIPADSPALRWLSPTTTNGLPGNAVPFAVGEAKEVLESEPNDSLAQANRVEVPVTINGRIQKRGDVDYFIFAAQKGQTLVMEVLARRLDSPLDAIITLLNPKGEELREVDDTDTGEPFVTHFADPRLEFNFPAAGDYILRIRDVQGNGGEDYAYRLSIAPPRPAFALRVMPDTARVGPGDTTIISVTALRKDGFSGEITLSVENLPPGFTASGAVLPAGQNEARLTLTAPRDAATNLFAPVIVGKAKIGDTEVVRAADPVEEATQAFNYKHIIPTKEYPVTLSEAPPFTISINLPSREPLDVRPEGEVQVPVKAFRQPGIQGEISLALDGAATSITVKPAVIPADKDEAALAIGAAKDAAVGLRHNLIITGTLKTAKETVTRNAPAIPIRIVAKQP